LTGVPVIDAEGIESHRPALYDRSVHGNAVSSDGSPRAKRNAPDVGNRIEDNEVLREQFLFLACHVAAELQRSLKTRPPVIRLVAVRGGDEDESAFGVRVVSETQRYFPNFAASAVVKKFIAGIDVSYRVNYATSRSIILRVLSYEADCISRTISSETLSTSIKGERTLRIVLAMIAPP